MASTSAPAIPTLAEVRMMCEGLQLLLSLEPATVESNVSSRRTEELQLIRLTETFDSADRTVTA
eukprot:9124270-Pyramimonas_sp.AAC.2